MKALLSRLRRRRAGRADAHRIYLAVVGQARRPEFYAGHGVPDSVDGRFEMIVLHLFLVLRRLGAGAADPRLRQRLYDLMFADMDRGLREMGVGDLGVAKHVKRMVQAFHGRVAAYEAALAAADPAALEAALARNLFGTVAPSRAHLAAMADYVTSAARALDAAPIEAILDGALGLAAPEAGAPGRARR